MTLSSVDVINCAHHHHLQKYTRCGILLSTLFLCILYSDLISIPQNTTSFVWDSAHLLYLSLLQLLINCDWSWLLAHCSLLIAHSSGFFQ